MLEDKECNGCLFVESLEKRIEASENQMRSMGDRVGRVEQMIAVSQERIEMIYKTLNEIKTSIDGIEKKIDDMESRPVKLLWAVAGTVAGALIISGLKLLY